jgi:hypothetical protein
VGQPAVRLVFAAGYAGLAAIILVLRRRELLAIARALR